MSERIEYTEVSPEGMEAPGDVYHYVTQSGLSDVLSCHVPARQSDWIYTHGYPVLTR